jgi:hypothetical protein
MIFDLVASDHASLNECVLLNPHLPEGCRRVTASPGGDCQAEKRGILIFGVSIRVQRPLPGIFAFKLSQNEFLYALLFLSKSSVRTVPIGVVGELIRGDAFYWGHLMAGGLLGSILVLAVQPRCR